MSDEEKAITMLEQIGRHECIWMTCRHNEVYEAIDIAIKALKSQNKDLEELKELIGELEEEKDDIDLNKTPVEEFSWHAGFKNGMARALLRLNCFVKRREGDKE